MPPQTNSLRSNSASAPARPAPRRNSSWYIRISTVYNRHFPTDKNTYNIRLPLLGEIFSIVSLHITASYLWIRFLDHHRSFIPLAYLVLSTAVACQLYWGLKIGDRKQYTPWIIFKAVEIPITIAALGKGIYLFRYHFELVAWEIVFGFLITFANIGLVYVIISKSLKYLTGTSTHRITHSERTTDENVYDFPQVHRLDNV